MSRNSSFKKTECGRYSQTSNWALIQQNIMQSLVSRFLISNRLTVCFRSEIAGSYLCQQQVVSLHLHLHWAASDPAPLDQARQLWEETCGMYSIWTHNCTSSYVKIYIFRATQGSHKDKFCWSSSSFAPTTGHSACLPELHQVWSHLHSWLWHRHQGRSTQLLWAWSCHPVHRVNKSFLKTRVLMI